MFIKIRNFFLIILFVFLYSCGVTDYISGSEEYEPEIESDIDLELKSAEDENFLDSEILNETDTNNVSDGNESISIDKTEQQLESTPVKKYDSVLLGNDEPSEVSEIVTEKPAITLPPIQKLELKNKIQYRIATINFSSGSSAVSYNGLKKIKRIVKLAKERNAKIKIVGHASKRTKDMPLNEHKLVNFSVSHQRAQTVAKLVTDKYKFPSENLITEAVSDSKPLFREDMPAGTKANQRTEIFIIY